MNSAKMRFRAKGFWIRLVTIVALAPMALLLVLFVFGKTRLAVEIAQIPELEAEEQTPDLDPLAQIHFLNWANRREAKLKPAFFVPAGDPRDFGPGEGPWPLDAHLSEITRQLHLARVVRSRSG